jgi:hypothetical protein
MATSPVNPFGDAVTNSATPDRTGLANPFGNAATQATQNAAPAAPTLANKSTFDVLKDIGGETWNAAKGAVQAVPQIAKDIGTLEIGGKVASGVGNLAGQAMQIPAAVKDINASPDPATAYGQAAYNTATQGAGQALTAIATEGAARGLKVVGPKAVAAVKNASGVPAAMSADTASTLGTIAHNEGLPPLTSETAREAADELQKSFIERAKSQYGVVDKAVGGDLKPVQERISNLKKAIRVQANVNPDLADKYVDELAQQQKTLSGLIDKAKANGVPNADDLMAAGDKDYARGVAMKKVSSGIKTASGEVKMGGHPNPQMFATQIDRMNNTGLLQRALGEDGAKAMMDMSKQGLSKAKTAAMVSKTAKIVGGSAAAAVGAAGGYKVAKTVLGAQ